MRHRIASHQFNRDTHARQALIKGLVRSTVEQGYIVTSLVKARETRRWLDKLMTKAVDDTVVTRRQLHRFFGRRDVVNTLVDRIAPAMATRRSGFTTMTRVGHRRGDNTQLVKLSLIVKPERRGTLKSGLAYPIKPDISKKPTPNRKPIPQQKLLAHQKSTKIGSGKKDIRLKKPIKTSRNQAK